jgi:UDP-galactopyranose mutase
VPRPENAEIYKQYKALADATPGVHFVGRLATYKYYNMDQVVAQALTLYNQLSTKPSIELVGNIGGATEKVKSREFITDQPVKKESVVANGNGKAVSN